MKLKSSILLTACSVLSISVAHADVITQWNFNKQNSAPSVGLGSIQSYGGTETSYISDNGSSDSGGYALAVKYFADQDLDSGTTGIYVATNTTGFDKITASFDLFATGDSSKYYRFDYTLDGGSTFTTLRDINYDVRLWKNGNQFDLTSIAGAANNPAFGFRVVSIFEPGTSSYAGAHGDEYDSTNKVRFDMMTISGAKINAVPEPMTVMGLGLGVAVVLRRRSRK